ncbi:MAG TPA: LLM class flavin-dependent oxidoreductase, partial [Nitrososphaeraceae archaeon]|nr:LLM class flavin-dependent oxidoreductase [Nitrososphaeraceae archaeon]
DQEDDYDSKRLESEIVNYNGKYYQLERVSFAPKPYQRPHPPIFIGTWGSSEVGLKRVAKYGDGWMASAYNITPDKFKENRIYFYRIEKD